MTAFGDNFTFTRPNQAPYVDATGVRRIAPVDQPRFDHAAPGRSLGLLVEAGSAFGQSDRVSVIAGAWSALTEATILHEWFDGVSIRADAHYATDPVPMIDGCLGAAGHHRRIAVMEGFLKNYGGWIWAIGQRWDLPRLVGTSAGTVIGSLGGTPLLAT